MAKKDNSFNEQAYLMWDHYIQKRSGAAKKLSRLSTKSEKTGLSFHKVTGNYQPGDFISKVMSDGNKFRRYQHLLDLESYKLFIQNYSKWSSVRNLNFIFLSEQYSSAAFHFA